jgi:hypothetical protein
MLYVVSASDWHVCEDLPDVVLALLHALHVCFKFIRLVTLVCVIVLLVLFVELTVPYLFDFFNLFLAELLPVCHLLTLLKCSLVYVIGFVAGSVIDRLLGDVAELKCNLYNLAHVHA